MSLIYRTRVMWTGFAGAPGYSNLYQDGPPDVASVKTFFNSISTLIPNGLVLSFPSIGDIIEASTGQITGTWTGPAVTAITGAATAAPFSPQSGAMVGWATSGPRINGRQPRGRTYLVPLLPTAFNNTGQLTTSVITSLTTAANTLVTTLGTHLRVWSRPIEGPVPRAGSHQAVTGAYVFSKVATLRSRRD
jgi:hypothetical protein